MNWLPQSEPLHKRGGWRAVVLVLRAPRRLGRVGPIAGAAMRLTTPPARQPAATGRACHPARRRRGAVAKGFRGRPARCDAVAAMRGPAAIMVQAIGPPVVPCRWPYTSQA